MIGERITQIDVSAYTIPTDFPESDSAVEWDRTTIIVVEIGTAGEVGLGMTYGDPAVARFIDRFLSRQLLGSDPMSIPRQWEAMLSAVRNAGRPGIASMAIAAVDSALWDLKARMLNVSLITLLGWVRDAIPIYGSGGFTSYSIYQLQEQFADWVAQGMTGVKMKVGRRPEQDLERVRAARRIIGPDVELFVDANGAYTRKQALSFAERFADHGVTWFEEPVSSDDLEGLRLIRDRAPAGMEIAAGEYGYDSLYFRRMLEAGAIDVLQADATRCAGVSGFMEAGVLADAYQTPLSAHTAPSLHAHVCCAVPAACHAEYLL